MKSIIRFIALFIILLFCLGTSAMAADSFRLQITNNQRWFFYDGGILQADGNPDFATQLIYSTGCDVLWTLPLSHYAAGRKYCELVDDQTLVLLYHDEQNRYFIEKINVDGKKVQTEQLPSDVSEAAMFDEGYVYLQKNEAASMITLTVCNWRGQQKSWSLYRVKRMYVEPVDVLGGKLYLEAHYRDINDQPVISQLCISADSESAWEYRLNYSDELLIKGRFENRHGGVSLLVQTSKNYDDWELTLIELDGNGKEVGRHRVDGIEPTLSVHLIEREGADAFRIWGWNDGKIITALFNVQGQMLDKKSVAIDRFGTCVKYINDEVYVSITDAYMTYIEVVSLDALMQ